MHSSTFGIYKCSRSSVLGITERHINLPIESSCGCVHTIYRHSTHSNIYIRVSWNVSTLSMMYHLHRERNNQVSTSHHSLNIHRILFGSLKSKIFLSSIKLLIKNEILDEISMALDKSLAVKIPTAARLDCINYDINFFIHFFSWWSYDRNFPFQYFWLKQSLVFGRAWSVNRTDEHFYVELNSSIFGSGYRYIELT